jgi:hypothetical protein
MSQTHQLLIVGSISEPARNGSKCENFGNQSAIADTAGLRADNPHNRFLLGTDSYIERQFGSTR